MVTRLLDSCLEKQWFESIVGDVSQRQPCKLAINTNSVAGKTIVCAHNLGLISTLYFGATILAPPSLNHDRRQCSESHLTSLRESSNNVRQSVVLALSNTRLQIDLFPFTSLL